MNTNFEKYKKDLDVLLDFGGQLFNSMQYSCYPKEFLKSFREIYGDKTEEKIKELPDFNSKYQSWYSEALILIKQILPDRLDDFIRHYEAPKQRKEVNFSNYTIEDHLRCLVVTRNNVKLFGSEAAIARFAQQIAIVKSVYSRFSSTLFDIRQLVQADMFDSELDAAKELANKGFRRAAGALAGVVLEHHLFQICENHNIKVQKIDPSISELNDILKKEEVIETPVWRNIQYLGDIRNLCDHDKKNEPTQEQIDDLLAGTMKIIKTLF
jgi:hypothetical protein